MNNLMHTAINRSADKQWRRGQYQMQGAGYLFYNTNCRWLESTDYSLTRTRGRGRTADYKKGNRHRGTL